MQRQKSPFYIIFDCHYRKRCLMAVVVDLEEVSKLSLSISCMLDYEKRMG